MNMFQILTEELFSIVCTCTLLSFACHHISKCLTYEYLQCVNKYNLYEQADARADHSGESSNTRRSDPKMFISCTKLKGGHDLYTT